ncbi:DUF542 domain-containing protein [Mariniblastus fucicola]|uniref:Glyoxalase-like domain protein n=1 Tax=Mariniblastus fucicola TaxID=980251 RepID=A0A5B9P857_9BACT|nr:DUF542 domain-containing protein [Mariniblastus fucicola]QEG22478.1 Glyoxalase-like domain protein [Mariniblastus fucicola]
MLEARRTNTILYCERWLETVLFYREAIGLPASFENDWFVEFKIADSSFLSIANAARATIEHVQGQGVTLSWQVENLPQIKRQLDSREIQTAGIKPRWNSNVLYFHDPEGHRIELWEPFPECCNLDASINCDLATSVPDWLIEYPILLALFQKMGIDYCCGGKSLETACLKQGLDPTDVLQQASDSIRTLRKS